MIQNIKKRGSPTSIDIHVGKQLRTRRFVLGLSQATLAQSIGLTFQQIQKYEKGTNRISAGQLFQLSHALNVPVSYFYENLTSELENFIQDDEAHNLVQAYYSIKDKNMRKKVFQFVLGISENEKPIAQKTAKRMRSLIG